MTVVEVIGMQQMRIHILEEDAGKVRAANAVFVQELRRLAPERFEGVKDEDIMRVIAADHAAQPVPEVEGDLTVPDPEAAHAE